MKPKLKQRKKSYRKFCDRRKNDVRNRVSDGNKMMATKPLHSTCPSVADKSTKGQQHSNEPTSTNMSAVDYTNPLKQCTSSSTQNIPTHFQPDSTLLERHHPNLSFEEVKQHLQSDPISTKWTPVYSSSSIHLCIMKVSPMSQAKVERSVTVSNDVLACTYCWKAGRNICKQCS